MVEQSEAERAAQLGQSIKALREAAGMSQADLAEAMTSRGVPGIYPQTITKIEAGKRSLKYLEAVEMADALDLLIVNHLGAANKESAHLRRQAHEVFLAHATLVESIVAFMKAFDQLAGAVAVLGGRASSISHNAIAWLDRPVRQVALSAWSEAERRFGAEALPDFDPETRDVPRRWSLEAVEAWRQTALEVIRAKQRADGGNQTDDSGVMDDGEHQETP